MTPTSIVIGAGIVGLHVARVLREAGHEVYVLDKAPYLAEHTSGRNSGVIHAGIFYSPGSFKEEVCLEGNRLTYEWAQKLGVPHQRCGKWIVPEPGQEKEIEAFYDKIASLPIDKPRLYSRDTLIREEPNLKPLPAILVPSTGIIDAASYVKSLARYVESIGVTLLLHCNVESAKKNTIFTTRGEMGFDVGVNCAGLHADKIAALTGLDGYEIRPCRGDYFVITKKIVKRPVYHLPYHGAHGLGVHLTPTTDEQTLVGPNAFFIEEKEDYQPHSSPEMFTKAIQYYLQHGSSLTLNTAYSGNRPKLYFEGKVFPEFTLVKNGAWVHLLGIESPGLTAAPALAERVRGMIC